MPGPFRAEHTQNDIYVHGQSLGGSAVLFAAGREPRLLNAIAEGLILNFDRIVQDGGSPKWFLPVFKLAGRVRGFDLSHQPVDVCKRGTNKRILITHVTGDPVTPVSQLEFVPDDQDTCTALTIGGDWHIGWAAQQPVAFKTALADWLAED